MAEVGEILHSENIAENKYLSIPDENESKKQHEKTVEFNLSDPDELLQQLESVSLTDEDADELLREAYKINMKLKEMLRRQESKASANRSQSAVSDLLTKSKTSKLPPISKTSKSNTSSAKRQVKSNTRSSKPKTPSREREPWNDRFSFS